MVLLSKERIMFDHEIRAIDLLRNDLELVPTPRGCRVRVTDWTGQNFQTFDFDSSKEYHREIVQELARLILKDE
jgi:hypothetical protein